MGRFSTFRVVLYPWFQRDLPGEIDKRIAQEIGRAHLRLFQVYTKELPHYRFVDLYRATEHYCEQRGESVKIESEHEESLNSILHSKPARWMSRRIKRASKVAWPIGPGEESYLPLDVFWLCKDRSAHDQSQLIVRLRYVPHMERAILEAASDKPSSAEAAVTSIVGQSAEVSIYRNKVLELTFESGAKDEYGDVERPDRLRVLFKAYEHVGDEDIVIDDTVRQILWRNIIDLHLRRDVLKAHHVPVRRGVLLYGPPGTGKTFACRYLCGKLPNATRIIATGTALLQVSSVFSLARMLQPALLILEDVDLVFASREINLYSSVLGDLLDQMDGLRPHEDVGIVLTTNSIDRLEAAIKDRPGRISQCIFFGPPTPELRKRYLVHYLHHYEPLTVDLDELVARSNGATQAFLKEWVHRAVQMAAERLDTVRGGLELRNDDFRTALAEMRQFSEGSTGRIIGFHEKGQT